MLTPPAILIFLGLGFFYFLLSISEPPLPVPAEAWAARVVFPNISRALQDRVVGFALVNGGSHVHIAWMGQMEKPQGHAKAVMQHYLSPISTTPAPNTSIVLAIRVEQRELDGTVTHIAFNRLPQPVPTLAMVYRKVTDETMSFHVDLTPIGPTIPSGGPVLASPNAELKYTLPGNLPISRAAMSASGSLVASRYYDESAFRIYRMPECLPSSPCVADRGIPGPNLTLTLDRHLLATELYSPENGITHVFSVSFTEASEFFRVSMSIFSLIDGEWVQDELWNRPSIPYQRAVYSELVGHEVLEAANEDHLAWLKSPVVAATSTAHTLSWLFMGRVFTLDYVNATAAGKRHGYVLDDSAAVHDLHSADLCAKLANVNSDGTVLVVVNEKNDILTFEREAGFAVQEHFNDADDEAEPWWDAFFSVPNEVAFFWDGALESTPMSAKEGADSAAKQAAAAHHRAVRKPAWQLKSVWPNNMHALGVNEYVVALNLLEPDDLKGATQGEAAVEGPHVLLLYNNNVLSLLSLGRSQDGSHAARFLARRWPMLVAMSGVVAVFVGNEIRGGISPRYHALCVAGLAFWTLCCVVMTIDD
ncbi:hypothetical protein HDU87_006361 [Geranomyces variabilis]|uniref:Uncharacterized protein n=1 Tax=Geranomyces variabilis TaxID=109894 RepID=A0AAD5XQM0_9FUNG|nr:hypothetical protein HDU87_006361 [Geranomyces variabilis]